MKERNHLSFSVVSVNFTRLGWLTGAKKG